MLAWDLPATGWEVVVLSPTHRFYRNRAADPSSAELFNPRGVVHGVDPGDGSILLRLLRVNGVGWRAFRPLYRAGLNLLHADKFDLVYITTTQFLLFCLGALWQRRTGVPYVLDFQDPWVKTDKRYVTTTQSWKSWLNQSIAPTLERFAVRRAAGITAVSPLYLEQLRSRHPRAQSLSSDRADAVPFGALQRDLDVDSELVDRSGARRIIYIGAGGNIMAKSFARICELISKATGELRVCVSIELYGTDTGWHEGMPKFMERIAARYLSGNVVMERPNPIPYTLAMAKITAADGLLVLGVDDPAYMPSKLFTYALTGKPLLACLHNASQADRYFEELPGLGHLIHFGNDSPEEPDAREVNLFMREVAQGVEFNRRQMVAPYMSEGLARRHAKLFDKCTLSGASSI